MKFEIQPVTDPELPAVARFLYDYLGSTKSHAKHARRRLPSSIEACLRWLLSENPLTNEALPYGYCARDPTGAIRSLSLNFPNAFTFGGDRMLGLCSGSYYVDPEVRPAGLFLFRRYLASPGYSFFFATTCNANSGAIFKSVPRQRGDTRV